MAAANSSAFPVCEAHRTISCRAGTAGAAGAAAGAGARENMHRAVAGAKGALSGRTGTPPGGATAMPDRNPDR